MVNQIDLANNNLRNGGGASDGQLPTELGQLSNLENGLDLSGNAV